MPGNAMVEGGQACDLQVSTFHSFAGTDINIPVDQAQVRVAGLSIQTVFQWMTRKMAQ